MVEYVVHLLVDGNVDVDAHWPWLDDRVSHTHSRGGSPAMWRTATEITTGPELHDKAFDSHAVSVPAESARYGKLFGPPFGETAAPIGALAPRPSAL
jgi:hypothetical protein